MYPNPANNKVYVKNEYANIEDVILTIYNLHGEIVYEKNFVLGKCYFCHNEFLRAENCFLACLKYKNNDSDVLNYLGRIKKLNSLIDEANNYFEKSLYNEYSDMAFDNLMKISIFLKKDFISAKKYLNNFEANSKIEKNKLFYFHNA